MSWNLPNIGKVFGCWMVRLIAKLDMLWGGMGCRYGILCVAFEASSVSLDVMITETEYRISQI